MPWTVAHQAPLSMEFSRQEYWRGLPCPSPRVSSQPRIKLGSSALQTNSLPSEPPGKPLGNAFSAHMVQERMADCLEEETEMWAWPQASERELPVPFQASTPRARCQPGGAGAGPLCAYSCHLSHWAGKASRLPGASKGSPEVTGCCSCPRKGCSQTVGQSRKPDMDQLLGFPGEWEQEIGSQGKAERQQAPEPGGRGAVPEAGALGTWRGGR